MVANPVYPWIMAFVVINASVGGYYLFRWLRLGLHHRSDKVLFAIHLFFWTFNHFLLLVTDSTFSLFTYFGCAILWSFTTRMKLNLETLKATRAYLFVPSIYPPFDGEPDKEFWSPTPIRAYRHFKVHDRYLYALTSPEEFFPDEDARCRHYGHALPAPLWVCSCGYYALKRPYEIPTSALSVEAVVELSGTVIEHERGYRAQKMKIVALRAVTQYGKPSLKVIASRFEVPIYFTSRWPRHLERLPDVLPD